MDVFFLITHRHEDNMAPTPSTRRNRYSAFMNHSATIFVRVNETHESCPSLPGSYPTEWKIQGRHHHTHSGPSREFVKKSKVPKSSQCLDSVECSRVQCAVWDLPSRKKRRTLISYFPAQLQEKKPGKRSTPTDWGCLRVHYGVNWAELKSPMGSAINGKTRICLASNQERKQTC